MTANLSFEAKNIKDKYFSSHIFILNEWLDKVPNSVHLIIIKSITDKILFHVIRDILLMCFATTISKRFIQIFYINPGLS